MFNKYQSDSLQDLALSLAELLRTNFENPLQSPWIVVQNNEIKNWLQLVLAKQNNIAANLRFIFPSEFMWTLYRQRVKEIPASLPSDLHAMQWALFSLFSEQPEKLDMISSLNGLTPDSKKLFQFCGQLADVFDQYQVYRPKMMEEWIEGSRKTSQKEELWQAEIWRELASKWNASSDTKPFPRRSQAFTELIHWLQNDHQFFNKIPSNLYVFGLSQLSKPFLEIITAVAAKRDVHFFSKKESNLSSIQTNELFARWSKPRKEQLELLAQLLEQKNVEVRKIESETSKNVSLPNISIHSCHNKRREVEVLKNEMLGFLDTHPETKPHDILILVPDADAYAGTLETIFSNDTGEPALPISKLSGKSKQSAAHALSLVLNILDSSFKASEVIKILNLIPIREKFEFTESDIDIIEDWITQNRIFWGLGEDINSSYSWTKGLNQLLAGFAIEPQAVELYKGLVPFDGIFSSEQVELAAKFSSFIYALKDAAAEVSSSKKPQEWISFISELAHKFIGDSKTNSAQKLRLHRLLKKLDEQAQFANSNITLCYDLIKPWLCTQIESENSSSGRFGQGITISSYIPYRSVPFQFIAMLGMNESVFPRKSVRPDFDLVHSNPQSGDRVLKEDDTLLFLETIEAAQIHLHLSFEGQDQKSDNIKLPSILIQQLADATYENPDKAFHRHALHPYNKMYFTDEVRSFSGHDALLAKTMLNQHKETIPFLDEAFKEQESESSVIDTSEFISFFSHPSKWFVRNHLDIKNYTDLNESVDRENFKINGLDKYKLNQLLFDCLSDSANEKKVFDYSSSMALIPEGYAGEKAFDTEHAAVSELLNILVEQTNGGERKEEIAIETGDKTLTGTINGIFGDKLITYRVGNIKAKYLAEHWLKHLLLLKAGIPISQSLFIYKKGESAEVINIDTAKIPQNPLDEYVQWFLDDENLLKKLAFFPESSKTYAESFIKENDAHKALNKAKTEWEPSKHKYSPESEDYFNELVWRGRNPLETKHFSDNALKFWEPFLITQKKEKKKK